MKQAFVDSNLAVTIRDTDLPVPKAGQVRIRVVVSGSNPKDWKYPGWNPDAEPSNQGDDIAGFIDAVGDGVLGFKKGDKVAAFHEMLTPDGSWAEYAIAGDHAVFHLADETSFEEAATIPLAAMTSALGLYQVLGLPLPWNPTSKKLPLVVYGGATAVGAFAIKFARLSNIHPIIAIASRGASFVETLIDRTKGDTIIDYREEDEIIRNKIKAAAGGTPIHYAYDAVAEKGSYLNIAAALTVPGKITTVLPVEKDDVIPKGIDITITRVASVYTEPAQGKTIEHREFGAAFFSFIGRGLAQGWFSGHPYEVRPGGLSGIEGLLHSLKAGNASALKYVVRIGETTGLAQ